MMLSHNKKAPIIGSLVSDLVGAENYDISTRRLKGDRSASELYSVDLVDAGNFEIPTRWLRASRSASELHVHIVVVAEGFEPTLF